MSSWLSTLARDVKSDTQIKKHCENRVFVGNDINLIDTAYSETEDKKVSLFFVPGDTVATEPVPGWVYNSRRFYAYLFIPMQDEYDGIPAWELATGNLGSSITNYTTAFADNCSYIGGRVYRQGRGYYIYVYEFDSLYYATAGGGSRDAVCLFLHTGETDGEAQYTLVRNISSSFDDSRGENISVNGIDNNFVYKFYASYTDSIYKGLNQKSFIITGHYNDNPPFAGKKEAKESGRNVYEVVSWRSVPVGLKNNVMMEITCVCNV